MKKSLKYFAWAGAILLLSGLSGYAGIMSYRFFNPEYEVSQLSKPIPTLATYRPAFKLPDIEGQWREISEWDGKIIVLNFWATWCPPCLKEIPVFNAMQEKYQDKVRFIGVAIDEWPRVKAFVKSRPINYPVLVEMDSMNVAIQYGNHLGVLPFTVFIDRNGEISSRHFKALSEENLEKSLATLF